MLRIIAMVGDAEASTHIQAAVNNDAHLQFVSERGRLAQQIGRCSFDVLVLGIREAGSPGIGALVRDTIATHPATRVFLVCARWLRAAIAMDTTDLTAWSAAALVAESQ